MKQTRKTIFHSPSTIVETYAVDCFKGHHEETWLPSTHIIREKNFALNQFTHSLPSNIIPEKYCTEESQSIVLNFWFIPRTISPFVSWQALQMPACMDRLGEMMNLVTLKLSQNKLRTLPSRWDSKTIFYQISRKKHENTRYIFFMAYAVFPRVYDDQMLYEEVRGSKFCHCLVLVLNHAHRTKICQADCLPLSQMFVQVLHAEHHHGQESRAGRRIFLDKRLFGYKPTTNPLLFAYASYVPFPIVKLWAIYFMFSFYPLASPRLTPHSLSFYKQSPQKNNEALWTLCCCMKAVLLLTFDFQR